MAIKHRNFDKQNEVLSQLSSNGAATEKISSGKPKPAVLFEIPEHPKIEVLAYFLFQFGCILTVFYRIYLRSAEYGESTKLKWIQPSDWTFFGGRKDYSNYEWQHIIPYFIRSFLFFCGHTFLFNKCENLFGRLWSPIMLVYWVGTSVFLVGYRMILMIFVQAIFIYINARLFPHWLSIWLSGIINLVGYNNYSRYLVPVLGPGYFKENYLVEVMYLTYKQLQFISFSLTHLNDPKPEDETFLKGFYNMLWYAFYLPYNISIVVIYDKFYAQMKARHQASHHAPHAGIWLLARCLFYILLLEFGRHHLYFDAMLRDPDYLRSISMFDLISIGYLLPCFFHFKYVVIFGFPRSFALMDNMTPHQLPGCISRIALYSKHWRNFDRGIYEFFKTHIFVPIAKPSFSLPRRIVATLISFTFVIAWHGANYHIYVWIGTNVVGILTENLAKAFYGAYMKNWREAHVSDQWFRRFVAVLQIWSLALGTYGMFYFLGGSKSGWVWVDRLFWGKTVTFTPFIFKVYFFGYCYCQVAIHCEQYLKKKSENQQGKIKST